MATPEEFFTNNYVLLHCWMYHITITRDVLLVMHMTSQLGCMHISRTKGQLELFAMYRGHLCHSFARNMGIRVFFRILASRYNN